MKGYLIITQQKLRVTFPEDYVWRRIKGVDGQDGQDGQSVYKVDYLMNLLLFQQTQKEIYILLL